MNRIQSRLTAALTAAALIMAPAYIQTTLAQPGPGGTIVRTVLASTRLPSVVEAPLFFKLSKVDLAVGQSTKYVGPLGFIYVLSGSLSVQTDAGQRSLQKDDAYLVSASNPVALSAAGPGSTVLLHYVLARSAELDQATAQPPGVVTELYRMSHPIPHLKPGPYEFTLTRVSYPSHMAPNAPHYRSGAALYYILSGSGTFIADGDTQIKPTGTPHFEPYGWVHQWANGGDTPLVLLQANLSEEGVPAVIMDKSPPSAPTR